MPPLSQIITRSRPYRRTARALDRMVWPGFGGASLYAVGKVLFREIRLNKLNIRGAAVTYNFFMAIPPSLLFFCSLVPYLPLKGVEGIIMSVLRVVTPSEASYSSLRGIVEDFLHNERRDILSFGILTTFFFSSNGIMGLMRSFDRALPMYVQRSGVKRRWTAIKLTFMVLVVTIFTIGALILQTAYINRLIDRYIGHAVLIQVLTLLIIALMIFFVVCMVYTYGPSLTKRFSFISAGAVLATCLCIFLSAVFFFLVKNVIHYNKVYGSIGTLMAFMVWLFLNTQVILLGYELNVSILLVQLDRERASATDTQQVEQD
jgi:membrane protein